MSAQSKRESPNHESQLWYVKRGTTVRGPFRAAVIKRYMVLGRIQADDQLSRDREDWLLATQCPPFSADGFAGDVVDARADDERHADDRRAATPGIASADRRAGRERRTAEAKDVVARRARRDRVFASVRPAGSSNLLPATGVALVVVAIGLFAYLAGPGDGHGAPVCDASPAPAVNWSNCRKEHADFSKADLSNALLRNARLMDAEFLGARLRSADLAYADLSGAKLGFTDLEGATLIGANLRQSDFAYANLRAADLSYADLREAILGGADLEGARFDHALWLDGRKCAPGSVGSCL